MTTATLRASKFGDPASQDQRLYLCSLPRVVGGEGARECSSWSHISCSSDPSGRHLGKGLPGSCSAWASDQMHRIMSGARGSVSYYRFQMACHIPDPDLGPGNPRRGCFRQCLDGPYPTDQLELMGGQKERVLLEDDPLKVLDW